MHCQWINERSGYRSGRICSLASLPYRAYKKVWSSLKRSHNIELLIAMSVAHCSVFLILVFAIRLGHGATIPTLSSTAPTTIPRPVQLQGSSPTSINTSTVECEVNYYTSDSTFSRIVCRCDEQLCTQFGDCCAESQYTHNTTGPEFVFGVLLPLSACFSIYVQTASTPYIFRRHMFSHPLLQLVYLHQLMEGKHQLHKLLKAQNSISTSCSRMQQQHTTCARAQPQTLPYPCTSCMLVLHPSIQCKLLHNTTASKAV